MGEAIKIAPYVAFFPEPATAQSRFLIQGYVDREEIAAAVEALVELQVLLLLDQQVIIQFLDHSLLMEVVAVVVMEILVKSVQDMMEVQVVVELQGKVLVLQGVLL